MRGAGAPLALLAAIGGRAGIIACAEARNRLEIGSGSAAVSKGQSARNRYVLFSWRACERYAGDDMPLVLAARAAAACRGGHRRHSPAD